MGNQLLEMSTVSQWRVIFPLMLNANNTLFGGEIMRWMDELTYICATRFARTKLFTAYTEPVHFDRPARVDDVVELRAKVCKITPVRIYVKVELFKEEVLSGERTLVAHSTFVYVSLNDKMLPCKINYPFDYDKVVAESAADE